MSYRRYKEGDRLEHFEHGVRGTVTKSTPEVVTIRRDEPIEAKSSHLTGYHWEFKPIGGLG